MRHVFQTKNNSSTFKICPKISLLCLVFLPTFAMAQQSDLQNIRPVVFTKPVPLDWKTVPFESLNYNVTSLDGGASLYTLPSKKSLKFSITFSFPATTFYFKEENRPAYGAMANMLLMGGFGSYSFEQVQQKLMENGINLQTGLNTYGQTTITASGLSSDYPLVISLIKDLILKPKFDNNAFEIWKQESRDGFTDLIEANTLQKQMHIIDNQATVLAFGEGHFYAKNLERLSPAKINSITTEQIKDLYQQVLNRNGLNIWLAGNFTSKSVEELTQFIAKIPKKLPPIYAWLPERTLPQINPSKIETVYIKKAGMTQSSLTMRFYYTNLGKLNSIEKTELQIISEIFSSNGGTVGNDRFSKVMRADSGISYSPRASFIPNLVYPNTNISAFYLNFQAPNERLAEAVGLAKKTWDTFVTKGITQDELDMARTSMMNRLLATEETLYDKNDSLMEEIIKGIVPNKTPIEFQLAKLDQIRDVAKINSRLSELSHKKPLTVLAIMGNADDAQLSALSKEPDIEIKKTLDYSSFANSF